MLNSSRLICNRHFKLLNVINQHLIDSLHTAWEQQMAALEAGAAELHAEVGALRNLLNEKNAQVCLRSLEEWGR